MFKRGTQNKDVIIKVKYCVKKKNCIKSRVNVTVDNKPQPKVPKYVTS